jgi:hypothetical protein
MYHKTIQQNLRPKRYEEFDKCIEGMHKISKIGPSEYLDFVEKHTSSLKSKEVDDMVHDFQENVSENIKDTKGLIEKFNFCLYKNLGIEDSDSYVEAENSVKNDQEWPLKQTGNVIFLNSSYLGREKKRHIRLNNEMQAIFKEHTEKLEAIMKDETELICKLNLSIHGCLIALVN